MLSPRFRPRLLLCASGHTRGLLLTLDRVAPENRHFCGHHPCGNLRSGDIDHKKIEPGRDGPILEH